MIFISHILSVSITPIPAEFMQNSDEFIWIDKLQWSCQSKGNDCMGNIKIMIQEFKQIMFPKGDPLPEKSGISTVSIEVMSLEICQTPLQTNDSYSLVANQTGFFIIAETTFGVSRALASLAQIIEEPASFEYKPGKYAFKPCKAVDRPYYPYRSIMIDAARHFLPQSSIMRQILAAAITKLNVVHIHLIDSQSNAFKPNTKPADEFEKASYYSGRRFFLFVDQLIEIQQYAMNLGIFIEYEIDMPGHAASWRMVREDLVANCPTQGYTSVNPLNEDLFTYIEAYLGDIVNTIFKATGQQPLIHLGGDEVDHNCWNADPKIKQYMNENKIDTVQLWKQFHERVYDLVKKLNSETQLFYWQESWDNGNNMDGAIVHVWLCLMNKCTSSTTATNAGHFVINSNGWYLDMQKPGQEWYLFQDSWKDFYKIKPDRDVAQDKKHLVLGGGACNWGEKVSEGNLDETIWPRTISVAEVLWSNPLNRDPTQELLDRFSTFSCKLVQGGVGSGPFFSQKPCPGMDDPKFD